MAPPTAIVTGASSGIGFALTKYLLERKWAVVVADINPPKETLPNTLFIKTDVSSWDQQANMFKQAYEWQGRLDFFAANAGIDDRDDIFASISSNSAQPPKQPNLQTFEVNLNGSYYGIKLASHYMSLDSKSAGKPKVGGKIVVTASAAGIYPFPYCPQYAATKHALVGLVRSLGPVAKAVNIRINALCPAFVATGLAPGDLLSSMPKEQITPMSTMMRCFSELASLDDVEKENWVETGRAGQAVEGNLNDLIWHAAPARKEASYMKEEKGVDRWAQAYADRNRNFAMMDWMKQKL